MSKELDELIRAINRIENSKSNPISNNPNETKIKTLTDYELLRKTFNVIGIRYKTYETNNICIDKKSIELKDERVLFNFYRSGVFKSVETYG